MKKFLFAFSLLLVSYTDGKAIPKEKIIPTVQEKVSDSLKLGKKYLDENNLKEAEKYLKISADSGDISSQYYLACMYEEEGKLNLAAKYFLKVSQHEDKKLVEKYMTEEDIEKLHKLIKEKIVNLDDLEEKWYYGFYN